jgi:type IV pilus assembly protein PilN
MIRINLLPFRGTRKKENIRQQASVFFLSFVLVLIVIVALHLDQGSRIEDLQEEIAVSERELVKFNKINREIATIRKQLKDLERKIDIIGTLESNREGPVRLLDAMTDIVIAKRLWFTSFEEKEVRGSPGTTSKTVTINGVALDNKTVADFMSRLEASRLFSSVNLVTLMREKKGDGPSLKSFQINCNRRPLNADGDGGEKVAIK